MIRRRPLIPGLAALVLTGCAAGLPRLSGGEPEEGGIGGTGMRAAGPGEGDGGIGGTGVFGAVTGFGSLRVNGLRLALWSGTAIESLARRGAPVLAGDTIAAEARSGAEGLLATRLAVFYPLIGPAGIGPGGALSVLGTPVEVPAGTLLHDPHGVARPHGALRPGSMLAVSGLWRGDRVVATSLRLLDGPARATLRGQLRRQGEQLVVGATPLRAEGLPSGLVAERFVTVSGVPTPQGLAVDALATAPLGVFARPVGALSVEGFVAPNRDAPGHHLSGFGLPLAPGGVLPPLGDRQLMLGRVMQGFRIEAGLALPAEASGRAAVLSDPASARAIAEWLARG